MFSQKVKTAIQLLKARVQWHVNTLVDETCHATSGTPPSSCVQWMLADVKAILAGMSEDIPLMIEDTNDLLSLIAALEKIA